MKYEYSNANEPCKLSTSLDVLIIKLQLDFRGRDDEAFGESLEELEKISKKINNFKPIIKINVGD